ncbi:hypothetical protein [Sinimarinibacterium sp. NLF-5-8]|uniref:hypothetical protein n=1 Tax=Sinimarinibacterium sp. NLF-5-8 TaxID=2698684 RepID=UPI00137BC212|nr:hypothetical protein [Sinimarinibacterium sp. NLF-5-8]QHS10045.1 hypothetical protein GT972_07735 [Sinimarinibacterium sp. NLF-5-8]
MLVVGYASARWAWYAAIPLGWLCYLLAALLLDASGLARALWLGLAALPALFLAARLALPKPRAMPAPVHLPRAELFARMAAAALLVLTLTTVTRQLGSQFTGLLSGAPVAAVVIPAFTFATAGRDALLLTLSGFLTGLVGFGVCFLVLAYTMTALGFWALIPALIAGVACGLLSTHWAAAQRRARV